MSNTENHDQSTFPAKRKYDLAAPEESSVKAVKKSEDVMEKVDERREIENVVGGDGVEEEDDDESDADYEAEDARRRTKKKRKEEEEEDVGDLKGKGIMRDDKGKGKMIVGEDDVESGDASDDDDVDGDDNSDDDSEDSDDSDEFWLDDDDEDSELENPLGEVNLDNILPSRTRSRGGGAQKGIVIADDPRDGHRNGDDSNSNA